MLKKLTIVETVTNCCRFFGHERKTRSNCDEMLNFFVSVERIPEVEN